MAFLSLQLEAHGPMVGSANFKGGDLRRRLGYEYLGDFYVQTYSVIMFGESCEKHNWHNVGGKIQLYSLPPFSK